MNRRVLSFIIALAVCLNLLPAGGFAADVETDDGLCPHHPAHTDACGYALPVLERECTHSHSDGCYTAETNCIHVHTDGCYPDSGDTSGVGEPVLCAHVCTQESGCVTEILSCPHGHDDACGYAEGNPGAPCTFVCPICPVDGLASPAWSGGRAASDTYNIPEDQTFEIPFEVKTLLTIVTNGHTLTGTSSSVIQVKGTGQLYLKGGGSIACASDNGVGIEVESGGLLRVTDPGTTITGTVCALRIAGGADVRLSAGFYSSMNVAIWTEDGKPETYAALLEPGCAYFDMNGNPIPLENMAAAQVVTVGPCADHSNREYTHAQGAVAHSWTCTVCGIGESEPCRFEFQPEGAGTGRCVCGSSVLVAVDERLANLVYNGAMQPEEVDITVTLTDGSNAELVKDRDYTVTYEQRKDVGEIQVTVTGVTFVGTFTKSYSVGQDTPDLTWDTAAPVQVNYDGEPADAGDDLPPVHINIQSTTDDLRAFLQYSHRKRGDSAYTPDLPTDAGTYKVIVSLPEMPNFEAAVSEPITLEILPIAPIITAPEAKTLVFNRAAQELVTPGKLDPTAVKDGLEIQFAVGAGPFTAAVPTGLNAGTYTVRYTIAGLAGNSNYNAVTDGKIDVAIRPKDITPTVELSQSSFLYDGAKKEPVITVKDDNAVIDSGQYTVTWTDAVGKPVTELRAAGDYTATIQNVPNGNNYVFHTTAHVEITPAAQNALTIIGQPEHVYYGDVITTLDTTGGSEDGTVTWRIAAGGTNSKIDENSGKLTVKDTGEITVEAVRTVPSYGSVSKTWTFTVEPKPVMAEVSVAGRVYDGTTAVADVAINAAVKAGDLVVDPGDAFTISGLKGTYEDANVGANKTVRLDASGASTTPDASNKYAVSYPAAVKSVITAKDVDVTVTLSGSDLRIDDNRNYYYEYNGAERTPTVKVTANDNDAVLAASDYSVTITDNKNCGDATVTVSPKAGGNYSFDDQKVNFSIKKASAVLTSTPQAKNLTYDKTAQELVTVGTATGGTVVYSLEKDDLKKYSETIPPKTDAGDYIVYYMVKGDENHTDTAPSPVSVTIKPKEITPKITLSQTSYVYDGNEKTPVVTVEDGSDTIDDSEYDVSYRDNVNAGTATAVVSNANRGNYIVNGTADFKITKAPAKFTTNPTGLTGLQYTGEAQELVKAGGSDHGTVVYSLNGRNDSTAIPVGTAVGMYTVSCKVLGDANHSYTAAPITLTVNIDKNRVNTPTISLSQDTFRYNGSSQMPIITVCDDNSRLIPQHEYSVTVTDIEGNKVTSAVDAGEYTVTVTTTNASNYVIQTGNTRTFMIVPADQDAISITGAQARVCYGDSIQLGVTGGTGVGTVTWKIEANDGSPVASTISPAGGLLSVKDVGGPYTVTATRSKDGNYSDATASWEFSAGKKSVTPVVTVKPKNYDGTCDVDSADITATVRSGDLVEGDAVSITGLTGSYDSAAAGTNKRVILDTTNVTLSGNHSKWYDIDWPESVTASIDKVTAKLDKAPAAADLKYNGTAQALVTAGATVDGIGTIEYSTSQDGEYSENIPTGTDVGKYPVWYRVADSANYTGIPAVSLEAEIKKGTPVVSTPPTATGNVGQKLEAIPLMGGVIEGGVPGQFAWVNPDQSVVDGGPYEVTFTPDDLDSYETVTIWVQVTIQTDQTSDPTPDIDSFVGSYSSAPSAGTNSAPMAIRNDAASVAVSGADGDKLVREAAEKQSENIEIKPEIPDGVTRAQISIPASTVRRIKSETNAALTVSSPIADVTIPHTALDTLGSVGDAVSVVTEQAGQAVAVTLTADGKTVENVPGGLTASIPAENAGPGTVAVLVHPDGTRETIQKSVAKDGRLRIPLSGSATVEIVDNSKTFDDVPSWAADAVAFATAHELFNGTSDTTFSPDEDMSRGMLATVLYNLEGQPDQALTPRNPESEYSDVSSDAWYTDGIVWAAENGVVNGYGDGRFGPNDSVTREQFVLILWRYAGSPEAAGHGLTFTDADEVSSYASEALRWAVESGILIGNGSGQLLPGGTVTRAEAAQMLKNFMENT